MKTWVVMDGCWFMTPEDGVYTSRLSDGVKLFTEEEAKAWCVGTRFTPRNMANALVRNLKRCRGNVRLANLELEWMERMVEEAGL